jgi:hypothetical protein
VLVVRDTAWGYSIPQHSECKLLQLLLAQLSAAVSSPPQTQYTAAHLPLLLLLLLLLQPLPQLLLLLPPPTWHAAQLNDVQLGHHLPLLQGLLGKADDCAGRVAASKLQ